MDADRHCRVIAIVASAGGHAAVTAVLGALPKGFDVPIVVMQHLGPGSTGTTELYRRHLPMAFETLQANASLQPGRVLVAPPRTFVELMPDGTCTLEPCPRGALDKPLDRLLDSVARSFGPHAIGVVLTGMGDDGASGARALHEAKGRVLVQSPETAEHPHMPRAAIAAGAVDLVVPLADLGQVIAEVAAGTPRAQAQSELQAIARAFGERGDVAGHARAIDWSATPLGPALNWSRDFVLLTRAVADNAHPMAVLWGPELIQVYNDKWIRFLGPTKHPQALGRPARDTWPEIWHLIGPMLDRVVATGEPAGEENFPMLLNRDGALQEVFTTFAYAPIRDPATAAIIGIHHTASDTTATVVAERRMRVLRDLAARIAGAAVPREACERAVAALAADGADLPFALVYQIDRARQLGTLAAAAGLAAGTPAAPRLVDLSRDDLPPGWPLQQAQARQLLLDDLDTRFPDLPAAIEAADGARPRRAAMLLPLHLTSDRTASAVLVAGLSPHRPLDEDFRSFLDLVAQQIASGLVDARARQVERERGERLAELDRVKTEFFANISHEFRTPLTLLIAPLEQLLDRRDQLPAPLGNDIDVAVRNARRLLGLVNDLLDFSQIEHRRLQVTMEPADLCALTSEVASAFRSAIESAGLEFRVQCDESLAPVPVNREFWEKVLSNLLSNAFKFTFEGSISVTLRALSLHAELEVSDTGVGIPATELVNVFKRFHRVRGTRARTAEGSGIGLAMVEDLVKRMGGQIRLRSREGQGTTFTIWMPYRTQRLAPEAAADSQDNAVAPAHLAGRELAVEASRWLASPDGTLPLDGVAADLLGPPGSTAAREAVSHERSRIVIADDNADLRDYLRRLLAPRWDVETSGDGQSALDAVRRGRPDVVLADVTMPNLDGFGLLKQVREDPELRHTPVVLVTARAGEEAAIEGLLAGADDYIAKPFSPRELVARVRAVVDRSRAEGALRASEAKYRTLFETMGQGYALCEVVREADGRAVDCRYLELNPAFERLIGVPIAAAQGRTAREVTPGIEDDWIEACDRVVRTGRPQRVEYEVAPPDRWYEVNFYPAGGDRCVGLYEEITERKKAEQRQAFLLRLSDALRTLIDPIAIQEMAMRLLGEHMGVNRAFYGDAQDDDDTLTIGPGYAHGTFPLQGHVRFSEFDLDMAETYLAGAPWIIDETHDGARFNERTRAGFDAIEVRSAVGVPLVKEGRVRGILSIHQTTPRRWSGDEVTLLQETAERTWAAVERGKAAQSLRASEERYRTLFETMGQGYSLNEVVRDADGRAIDLRYLELNPAFERLTGASVDAARGRLASEVFPGLDPFWVDIVDRAVSSGAIERVEHELAPVGRWYQSNFYPIGGDRCLSLYDDVTQRKRAEILLRESQERQAFLLELADTLRPLADPIAVQEVTVRMLGTELAVDRCYYAEFDWPRDVLHIHQEYTRTDAVSAIGSHPISAFRDLLAHSHKGEPLVCDDIAAHPVYGREADAYRARGTDGFILVPLIKQGTMVACMCVTMEVPRAWTPANVSLVEEVAERTWAAVERAQAEVALRDSEERHRDDLERKVRERTAELKASRDLLQATMDSTDDMIQVFEAVRDAAGEIVDFRWILNNHTSEAYYGDVLGKSLLANNPGVVEEGIFAAFKRVTETGEPNQSEHHYVHEQFDGWFLQSAVKLADGVATTTKDITAWKAAQDQVIRLQQDVAQAGFQEREAQLRAMFNEVLRENEELLRSAVEVARVGLWDWNVLTDDIHWTDEHFRLQGYAVGEVAPSYEAWAARIHPEDRPATEAALQRAMQRHEPYANEFRVLHPDGTVLRLRGRGRFFYDEAGRPTRMIGAIVETGARQPAAVTAR